MLNVPICTQGMQRTWWPEAGTIIVTGPYCPIGIIRDLIAYSVNKGLNCLISLYELPIRS